MNPPITIQLPQELAANRLHNIALVEDKLEVRESLVQLIGTFTQFKTVCICDSGENALTQIPPARPDLVLMDIFLPRMSGIECTARLRNLLPDTRILILTSSDDEDLIFPALEAGADGYLLKQSAPEQLRAAILELLNGGVPMSSSIARRVAAYFRQKAALRDQFAHLTPREKELLILLSSGYSNKEIAGKLGLSIETIQSYLKNVYKKMHVHSRAEAVMKYMSSRNDAPRANQ